MFPSTALCVLTAVVECSTSVLFRPSSESLLLRVIRSHQTGRPLPDETDPVRINSLRVDSRVSSRYAHTLVTSSVTNPTNNSQQIKFSVLLPEAAFITGFTL
ncbi:hyaluronan metabolic process [Homalodisca vitripennis]|nr:hyaluronan metabolic process [Homalodisca vitripennis]